MRQDRLKKSKECSSQGFCMNPTSSLKIKIIALTCYPHKNELYTKYWLASMTITQNQEKTPIFRKKKIAVQKMRETTETYTWTCLHIKWDPYWLLCFFETKYFHMLHIYS